MIKNTPINKGNFIPIIFKIAPKNPPNKIPRHLLQKYFSNPKNFILLSSNLWQRQKPNSLLKTLKINMGPIVYDDRYVYRGE